MSTTTDTIQPLPPASSSSSRTSFTPHSSSSPPTSQQQQQHQLCHHHPHQRSAILLTTCLCCCSISLLFLLMAQTTNAKALLLPSSIPTPDGSSVLTATTESLQATAVTTMDEFPSENLTKTELEILNEQIKQINSSISAQQQPEQHHGDVPAMQLEKLVKEKDKLTKRVGTLIIREQISGGNGTNEMNNDERDEAVSSSTSTPAPPRPPSDASRLLCQFFVFGILFGIVCSISACSCLFRARQPIRHNNSNWSARLSGSALEANIINRFSRIAEPFAPDKPYCLKFDERGFCYASPLTREVPPLPNYEQACAMPTLPPSSSRVRMAHQRQQLTMIPAMPPTIIRV